MSWGHQPGANEDALSLGHPLFVVLPSKDLGCLIAYKPVDFAPMRPNKIDHPHKGRMAKEISTATSIPTSPTSNSKSGPSGKGAHSTAYRFFFNKEIHLTYDTHKRDFYKQ